MAATTLGHGPKTVKDCEGIGQKHVCDVNRDPKQSPTTLAVCFAVAAGYRWGAPKPYLDTVEEKDGKLERTVRWVFDADSTVEFSGESVTFTKFWERIQSPSPDSLYLLDRLSHYLSEGISLPWERIPEDLRKIVDNDRVTAELKQIILEAANIYEQFLADTLPRFLLIREQRGRDEIRCYIPLNATPEERAMILAEAGLS